MQEQLPRSNFLSSSRVYNEGDGCFPSCPAGAQSGSQCCVAYTDVGKGREHDHMDVGGRTNQETESRSESFTTLMKDQSFTASCALL